MDKILIKIKQFWHFLSKELQKRKTIVQDRGNDKLLKQLTMETLSKQNQMEIAINHKMTR